MGDSNNERIIHEFVAWAKQTTASVGLRPLHEVCCTLRRAVRQTMGLRRPTIGLLLADRCAERNLSAPSKIQSKGRSHIGLALHRHVAVVKAG